MTEPNNHTPIDNQNEQTLNSRRNEIESLKYRLTKKGGQDRQSGCHGKYLNGASQCGSPSLRGS
jgi:hypothetical protein